MELKNNAVSTLYDILKKTAKNQGFIYNSIIEIDNQLNNFYEFFKEDIVKKNYELNKKIIKDFIKNNRYNLGVFVKDVFTKGCPYNKEFGSYIKNYLNNYYEIKEEDIKNIKNLNIKDILLETMKLFGLKTKKDNPVLLTAIKKENNSKMVYTITDINSLERLTLIPDLYYLFALARLYYYVCNRKNLVKDFNFVIVISAKPQKRTMKIRYNSVGFDDNFMRNKETYGGYNWFLEPLKYNNFNNHLNYKTPIEFILQQGTTPVMFSGFNFGSLSGSMFYLSEGEDIIKNIEKNSMYGADDYISKIVI